jgi:catechol 2,3-dioxygenase
MVADIGHVHLRVADLERSVRFYRLLGFEVRKEMDGAEFLAFGGYHHHLALNTWATNRDALPAASPIGLHHFAVRYRDRRDLGRVVRAILAADLAIESTSDCGGIADSVYVRDPDENGVELTWDRPLDRWPVPLPETDRPLDLDELCAADRRL